MKRFNNAAKQSNRARLREAAHMSELGKRSWMLLLATLAQSGGEITLSKGTTETVNRLLAAGYLDFQMLEGAVPGEYILRLLNNEPDATVGPVEPGGLHHSDVQLPSIDVEVLVAD
jgi:hypothetical protein